MLSKIDIEKELGKGINIYPFNHKNFKENSINLCVGYYAWTLSEGKVYFDNERKVFSKNRLNSNENEYTLLKGESAIVSISDKEKYVILLPQSTTLIESKETLATNSYIGGTYHSKVGIVSQGIGHIGTMLGPNFSGNSLIAIHNVSDEIKTLKIGESFVSVVFHYLNTPLYEKNPTVSGHLDKMAELGIKLTSAEREELGADWRGKIDEVREKMKESEEYKEFRKKTKRKFMDGFIKYFNTRNVVVSLILIIILIAMGFGSYKLDEMTQDHDWSNRFWTIICSSIFIPAIISTIKSFKNQ